MFRKIHSNRDPKATLYYELRRELGPYFEKALLSFMGALRSYPKVFYGLMILLLMLSAGLSFTVMRKPSTSQSASVKSTDAPARKPSLNDGFDQILETGAALKRTLQLRDNVAAILGKSKLGHADSLALEGALDSLRQIQLQIDR